MRTHANGKLRRIRFARLTTQQQQPFQRQQQQLLNYDRYHYQVHLQLQLLLQQLQLRQPQRQQRQQQLRRQKLRQQQGMISILKNIFS